jgi:hypothetical protein
MYVMQKKRRKGALPDAMDIGNEGVNYVPFCGTRVGELEFNNRIIRRVWVEEPVMRVIGIFEI